MKIVFHDSFLQNYCSDPAASTGRLDPALSKLKGKYEFITPEPCTEEDVLLAHSPGHLESESRNKTIFNMAKLAAGAAISSARLALSSDPAFGLLRPPGHHASPDHCWGFCFFNNVAIAVKKLFQESEIKKSVIIDFDLHFGDGTYNIFSADPRVDYLHAQGRDRDSFVGSIKEFLDGKECDIVAVSAGFDRHKEDWGGLLHTEDYRKIGEILGSFAREKCGGRLFAVLEGGYNPRSLGESMAAFIEGVES